MGERAYGYVRIETGDELSKRAKFALITWVGEGVPPLKKAKVSTDKASVKQTIQVMNLVFLEFSRSWVFTFLRSRSSNFLLSAFLFQRLAVYLSPFFGCVVYNNHVSVISWLFLCFSCPLTPTGYLK